MHAQVLRSPHIGHTSLLDQAHSLKLELAGKLPSLHDPPPAPSKHLTRCLRNRVQANYRNHRDVPILHRKELFICADHLLHQKFARLTRIEDAKGLYEDTRQIGTREGWDKILESKGLRLRGHRLLSGATDRSC